MYELYWVGKAWKDYVFWKKHDVKTFHKINELIQSINIDGVADGLGKPERLKYIDGWSRRINQTDRLIYKIQDNKLYIFSCRGHYKDK